MSVQDICMLTNIIWHLFIHEALSHTVSGLVQQSPEAGSRIPILHRRILRPVVASGAVERGKRVQWWGGMEPRFSISKSIHFQLSISMVQ